MFLYQPHQHFPKCNNETIRETNLTKEQDIELSFPL